MNLTISNQSDCIVVVPEGRLDTLTSEEFDRKVFPLASGPNPVLILDFSKLEYISSAGLRSVLLLIKQVQGNNGRIAAANLSEILKEIFLISGLDTLMHFYDSVKEAIEIKLLN
jgi:anti-anti-sigma factor